VRAKLRQPFQVVQDQRPGVFSNNEVVHQWSRCDRNPHLAGGVNRNSPVILSEMLNELQPGRGPERFLRNTFLVNNQVVSVPDLIVEVSN
jgi:hypothetical protein